MPFKIAVCLGGRVVPARFMISHRSYSKDVNPKHFVYPFLVNLLTLFLGFIQRGEG